MMIRIAFVPTYRWPVGTRLCSREHHARHDGQRDHRNSRSRGCSKLRARHDGLWSVQGPHSSILQFEAKRTGACAKKALPGAGWPSARSWHTAQQRADKDVACTRRYAHLGPDRLHGGACLPRRGARARPRARRRPVLGTAELCAACYPPRSRGRRFYPAAGLVARGQRSSGQAAARRRPGARRVCAALERRHPWCRAEPRGVVGQGLRSRRRAAAARTPRARARRWGLGQGRRRGAAPIASLVRAPIGCCAHRAWSRCPPPQGLATPWAGAGHRDDDDAGRTEHYPGGCLFILGEPMPHTFSAHLQPRPDPFSSQLCAARGVFWAASL